MAGKGKFYTHTQQKGEEEQEKIIPCKVVN